MGWFMVVAFMQLAAWIVITVLVTKAAIRIAEIIWS